VWQPTLDIFERLSARKSHNNNRTTILIIGVVLLILLLTLMSFALSSSGEQFDDDLPFFEIGTITWFESQLFLGPLLLGFELGVTLTIMRLEYLNSHIGEKRPSDRRIAFAMLSRLFRATRFLLRSVVFFVSSVHPFSVVDSLGSVFVRDRSTRPRARNILFIWKGLQGGL
jgi:hypothetical protein